MRFKMNSPFALSIILFLTIVTLLSSCEKTTTDPNNDDHAELSDALKSSSQASWQLLSTIKTQNEMSEMVQGNDAISEDDPDLINNMAKFNDKAKVFSRVRKLAQKSINLSKVTVDSLIWFEEWNDLVSGTAGRRAVYYDPATQNARVYEVVFQFPSGVEVIYDSTEVGVFVGPNFDDESDDRILSLVHLTNFTDGHVLESASGSVTVTEWDESNEVTAAMASNTLLYGAQTEFLKLQQDAQINADESGSVSERLDYRDGTFLSRAISFFANYTGNYATTWRDGTTESGTFDLLEDDNHALFTQLIDFASHDLLDKIERSAEYTVDPADSSSLAIVSQKVYFLDGGLDTARVTVRRTYEEDHWKERFTVQTNTDGESIFMVDYFGTHNIFEGSHKALDGLYTLFNGTEYEDGSGELWIKVYTSEQSYLNGDDPILTAHYIYNGDGSGNGEIAEDGKTYQISYTADGKIKVTDGEGNTSALSAY